MFFGEQFRSIPVNIFMIFYLIFLVAMILIAMLMVYILLVVMLMVAIASDFLKATE